MVKFKTMEQAKLEYFLLVYKKLNKNKSKTAKALGITTRTARTLELKCADLNIKTENINCSGKTIGIIDLDYRMPTNDARLKHLDRYDGRRSS